MDETLTWKHHIDKNLLNDFSFQLHNKQSQTHIT